MKEIKKNHELFLKFNEIKYDRFQLLISNSNIRRVVNSIPILLSTNNKKLPGYLEAGAPCGIINFRHDPDAMKFLQTRFLAKDIEVRHTDPFIEMLAVMGSVGTIAYTKESDFDYWVCIDKSSASAETINSFQKKVDAIQNWAMKEMEIEVNVFINDIENIRENIFAENKEEAFGSVIGTVLKDEFYRSSIIIAGKTPFWWVVPRFVKDGEYEELFRNLPPEYKEKHFIDLGNLYEISKEDFLGAALFLIIKSLGNPFKSIIKLGVLEKYLFGPDSSPLLSQIVKSNILRGKFDNKVLDSYILMFEEVYSYYESMLQEKNLLKILRQNLYLKINPQLSKYIGIKDSLSLPYKVLVMFKYIKEWGWTGKEIQALDNFENWDYNKTIAFWNMVKKFMLLSYQKISKELQKMKLVKNISESDFKLLTRKIRSHFSYEQNKIDHYITFMDAPHEAILNIEPVAGSGIDDDEWNLLKRAKTSDDKFTSTVLKTEKGLVRLLAWTAINQIYHPQFSRLKFQSGYSHINQNVVIEMLGSITNLFSGTRSKLKNEYYLRPAFNMANMIVINFGTENVDTVHTVHHIYQTSWGESYIDEYSTAQDLIHILSMILREAANREQKFEDYCVILTPEPYRKHYKEIELTFKEAYEFITRKDKNISLRFIASLGGKYVTVTKDASGTIVNADSDITNTLTRISLNPRRDITYGFVRSDARLDIMDAVYKCGKANCITMVYEENDKNLIIYIINERGNLFTLVKTKSSKEDAIIYLLHLCKNTINRLNGFGNPVQINNKMQVLQLFVNRFGEYSFEDQTRWAEEIYLLKFKKKKTMAVRISKYKSTEMLYNIAALDETNSLYMPLKRVPENVEKLMKSAPSICGIISDITFIDMKKNDIESGSTLYLLEKFRVEFLIDKTRK